MTAYTDAFWERVAVLAQTLDSLSYYRLLGVDVDAATEAIEEVYYRRAANMHPDRHAYQADPALTHALVRLYARFGEAFRILRTPALRQVYDQELAAGRLRLSDEAQQRHRAQLATPDPKTDGARKLLETARALLKAGNLVGGLAQLKLAAQFEPESSTVTMRASPTMRRLLMPNRARASLVLTTRWVAEAVSRQVRELHYLPIMRPPRLLCRKFNNGCSGLS